MVDKAGLADAAGGGGVEVAEGGAGVLGLEAFGGGGRAGAGAGEGA